MCHVLVSGVSLGPVHILRAFDGFTNTLGFLESDWFDGWSDYILGAFLDFW
jgi:hypothetical protein